MKICTKCKINKSPSDFRDHKAYKDGKVSWCKQCQLAKTREWKSLNKEHSQHYERYHRTKVKYGLTEADYYNLLQLQKGVCKICSNSPESSPKNKLYVDHCHKTGKVRGLLCDHCNNVLGRAKDSIDVLHSAIKYLEAQC